MNRTQRIHDKEEIKKKYETSSLNEQLFKTHTLKHHKEEFRENKITSPLFSFKYYYYRTIEITFSLKNHS